ncbi:M4 family metallopeptidase [Oryzihumus leptocrescens]|uniref:Zn-dependent metalloprotease n=1 Tax=Oryzihumus leptocrescens TaxID=297536 RepID=A0A542ZIZ5_9MICO|nr:M4 family metallopeptidase [Oryzihumus leptocrescens]TQL60279.1 Zn-dependent metalloprotease [Oryzihumus leptocrescens]
MARRRPTRSTTVVTVVAAALALLPGAGLAAASPAARAGSGDNRSALVRELLSRTRGQARIAHDQGSGRVTFVGAGKARVVTRPSDVPATGSADAAARAYLRHLAPLTGVGEPAVRSPEVLDQPWGSTVHYQQTSGGVPVLGGEVTVSLDRSHQLSAYSATTSDTTVDTTPRVSATVAARVAARVPVRAYRVPASAVRASRPELAVYDSRLLGTPGQRTQALVWRTEVTAAGRPDVRELVLVDAVRGAVVLHFSEVDRADSTFSGQVCDFANTRTTLDTCPQSGAPVVAPTDPGISMDAKDAYAFAQDTWDFYSRVLGRTSVDDHALPMTASVRYCSGAATDDCPWGNAYWNSTQAVFGDGFAQSEDVVAHELSHGLTQYTSGLLYYFQSGAINESMSDVMGELVQQTSENALEGASSNWQLGEDMPGGAIRSMKDPTEYQMPDTMTSTLWEPGTDAHGLFDAGGVHENSSVGNKAAYLITEGTHLETKVPNTFNGASFTGMTDNEGRDLTQPDAVRSEVLEKVANLYYTVERMMTPSANYADLYNLLPQACNALVAVGPIPRPQGTYTFRSADCIAVQHAVDATEMDKTPTKPGAGARPMAPMCTNGGTPTVSWSDGFEDPTASSAQWQVASTSATQHSGTWFVNAPDANTPDGAAFPHTGHHNMWGDDPPGDGVTPATLSVAMRTSTAIVPGVGTYLWFAHAYGFDEFDGTDDNGNPVGHLYGDGGRVEYTTTADDTHWQDAGPLIDVNGYTGTVDGSDSPLAGQDAFVGTSKGYTASRLDLSSLAGRSVRVRFVIGASSLSWGSYGWYVDDVKVYTCNPTTLSLTKPITISYAHSGTLSGALTVAGTSSWINGQAIWLYQKPHGSAVWGNAIRVTTTAGQGSYAFAGLSPYGNEDYLVKFDDSAPWAHSWASTTIYVAPTVSARASSTSFRLGGTVTLSGTVTPNHYRQYVYLQRYLGSGRWTTVNHATLTSASTYTVTWKPRARAAYVLRVVKNADSDHAGATSSTVTIHVR